MTLKTYLLLSLFPLTAIAQNKIYNYPAISKGNDTEAYFGYKIPDPYKSLEDSSEETNNWIKAEQKISENILNRYESRYDNAKLLQTYQYMHYPTLEKMEKYYVEFFKNPDENQGGRLFLKTKPRVVGTLAVDPGDYKKERRDRVNLSGYDISEDNKFIAFGVSHNGSDWREIRVKRIFPFRDEPDVIEWVKFSNIRWYKDGFFYKRYPMPNGNIYKDKNIYSSIYYHQLHTPQDSDKLAYENKNCNSCNLSFSVSHGRKKYLFVYDDNDSLNEHKLLYNNLDDKESLFDTMINSHRKADYEVVGIKKGKFIVQTTLDAPKGRLLRFDEGITNSAEEYIPEIDAVLKRTYTVGKYLMSVYLYDIDYSLAIYNDSGKLNNIINFPEGISLGYLENGWNDSVVRFECSSFLHPPIIFEYNVNSKELKPADQTLVKYDVNELTMEKVHYRSKDGTIVPMILAHRKDLKLNGKIPTILYGYGGFGITLTPFFDGGFIAHMLRGGMIAMPCIRGGGEFGEEWHENGSLMNKENAIEDFIAAAEYLDSAGYTNSSRLAIMGGSNGGLLVTAVANQRPDICSVVIASKGVYDMLQYQNYTVGHGWTHEYGSITDSMQFLNLLKYSPLHNIRKGRYPAMLVITGDHDDRVVPVHSYKYVATMQEYATGDAPILLYVEKNRGHTEETLDTQSKIYSFIYGQMGLRIKPFGDRFQND